MDNIVIRTERLTVYPLGEKALKALIAAEKNEALKAAYGEMLINEKTENEWGAYWSIELGGKRVGGLCFMGKPNERGEVEIGYGIDEEFRGRGYATEAAKAVVSWALSKSGVNKVLSQTEKDNEKSQNVLKKCGFRNCGERDGNLLFEKARIN